jgi:glycosyltransferase involved in cell wall biosynthesis
MSTVTLKEYQTLNVKIHFINRQFPGILFNTRKIKKLLREIQPDLLHAHFATHYGYWGACSGFHPFIVSAWGDDVLIHPKKFWLSWFVHRALHSADAITCDGENSKQAMLDQGVENNKIHVIFHGVDTKKFSQRYRSEELMKDLFNNTHPVVICLRGFNPIYNVETLIRAIPQITAGYPDVNFLIAGAGYEESRIKELAGHLGVAGSIRFVGWLTHEQLPAYLASADIYVSVSLSDGGVAVSTFEAMASGVAPIVTDVGDNSLWIQDGKNGFIIPPKRPDLLAEKILWLLKRAPVREEFGSSNRRLVEERLDYYKEMKKVHILYERLVRR